MSWEREGEGEGEVRVCVCVCVCTYLGIQVGVLGGQEGEGWGDVELSKLLHGLLHPSGLPLLLCVSILHHQRGGGSLEEECHVT